MGRVVVLLVRHEALLFASLATGNRELRESVRYLCVVCALPVGRSQVCKRQLIVPVLGYDPGPTSPGGDISSLRVSTLDFGSSKWPFFFATFSEDAYVYNIRHVKSFPVFLPREINLRYCQASLLMADSWDEQISP